MREGQKPFLREWVELKGAEQVVATWKYEICLFYFIRRCLLTPVFEFIFPARLRLVNNSESDPQIPHQTGQTMGKRKRTKNKSESTKTDASSLLPQVSTVLLASASGCTRHQTSFTFAEKTLQAACPR